MYDLHTEAIKQELLAEFNAVVTEAEHLLKFVTDEGGDKANALRAKMEKKLNVAKQRLRSLEDTVVNKSRAAARVTDEYVHENPWQSIGVAAGVGAALGVVIGVLLSRR